MDDAAVGLYLADSHYITPETSSPFFLKKLEEIIVAERIDFIFPLHSSEIKKISSCAEYLSDLGVGVIVPPLNVADLCIDKSKFIRLLKEHDFDHPETFSRKEDVVSYPIFIKPRVGSSSSGARKISNEQELNFYLKENFDSYIVQEYLDWKELTIDCYVNKNGVLVGCVPRFRLKVKDGKSVVAKTVFDPRVLNKSKQLLERLGYRGACNIQMFVRDKEIKIVEINPRLAAGGLPLAVEAGVNIPEMMLDDHFSSLSDDVVPYNHSLTMYRYLTEVFV